MLCLGLAPFSFIRSGSAPDPAGLPLLTWVRAAYAGAPWAGVASVGSSGANPLIAGTAPAVGANLNGLATADFNGSSHQLISTDFSEVMVPTTGYVIGVLFNADTLAAADANIYNDAGLVSDGYGFNFNVSDGGLGIGHYDGTWQSHRLAGLGTGTWTFGQVRYDGTDVKLRINGGAWSAGIAVGDLLTPATTYKMTIGAALLSVTARLDGRIAEIITAASLNDSQLNSYRAYLNARYAISV